MAKRAVKQIVIEELIDRINLSGLSSAEEETFKIWLIKSAPLHTSIETALRRGHSVKACANTYRRQTEYWVQIEEPDN